jgi:hypothetical protein
MSEIKNIDQLFKAKLSGRQEAYSESGWAGAEQLLNRHYKWLFWKKLGLMSLPLLLIMGAAVAYNTIDEQSLEQGAAAIDSQSTEAQPMFNQNEETLMASASQPEKETEQIGDIESSANAATQSDNQSKITSALSSKNSNKAITPRTKTGSKNQVISPEENGTDELQMGDAQPMAMQKADANKLATYSKNNAAKLEQQIDLLSFMPAFGAPHMRYGKTPGTLDVPAAKPAMLNKLRRFEFSVSGGALVAQGLLNDQVKRANPSVGYHLSFLADYHLNQFAFIQTGIGVQGRGGLANIDTYKLNNLNYTTKSLCANYLSVPIVFNYRFATRHAIGLGIQYNQLISVVAERSGTDQNDLQVSSTLISEKTGFVNSDFAALVQYNYDFAQRWSAIATAQFGVTDVTENSGTNKVVDRNTLVKLGCSYRLIRL